LSFLALFPVGKDFILQEIAVGELEAAPAAPLLLSGFPDQWPDAVVPVSATLQLNADLAGADREWLTGLAVAERQRLEAVAPKNYRYRVEPRAAVLAADVGQLVDFIETYGGLLELVPVLQSSSIFPEAEFVCAEDVSLEAAGGEYRLRCTCRVPIDREKCTWCRACIDVCEPGCISPGLEIDFGFCTLGGRCVAACSAGAIDLSAREEKEFIVPAVILLGEPAVELPTEREMIFAAAEREKFFRQVGEHQVEENVAWTRELCQYSGRLNLGCRRCQEACPAGALTCGADGVAVDHFACLDCGACVAVCPTGALQEQRFNDRQFISFFAELPLAGRSELVVGTAEQLQQLWWRQPGCCRESAFFLEYPQPGALTAMHFLFLFALGFQRVLVLTGGEEESPAAGRERRQANLVLERLFARAGFVAAVAVADFAGVPAPEEPHPLVRFYDDFSFAGRRRKLAAVLEFLLDAAGEPAEKQLAGEEFAAYGRLVCDVDRCTACVACLNECYTGALCSDEQEYTLEHRSDLCVQCGICVSVCPENALTLEPGLWLEKEFFTARVLSRAEPMVCRGCGARFGTRKSYERVVALLRERGRSAETEEVLAYCETCRAVKMFEAHEK